MAEFTSFTKLGYTLDVEFDHEEPVAVISQKLFKQSTQKIYLRSDELDDFIESLQQLNDMIENGSFDPS